MQLGPGLPDSRPPVLILNTGAPQGCVLSPLLYSMFTHECVAAHALAPKTLTNFIHPSCRAVSPLGTANAPPGMETAPPATAGHSRGWCGLPNASPGLQTTCPPVHLQHPIHIYLNSLATLIMEHYHFNNVYIFCITQYILYSILFYCILVYAALTLLTQIFIYS